MLNSTQQIIADGLLVALASCCLLHYIYTVIQKHHVEKKLRQQLNLTDVNQDKITNLQDHQKTTELANQILLEFLPKSNVTNSLSHLLECLLPDHSEGLCGFFSINTSEAHLVSGRGPFKEQSSWKIPQVHMDNLIEQNHVILKQNEFKSSGFSTIVEFNSLNELDEVYLISQPDSHGKHHLLITSELYPPKSNSSQQIELIQRIIHSIGVQLRQAYSLKQQQSEASINQNKVTLMEILNHDKLSPVVNIQNFIQYLVKQTGAFRANLYLTESEEKLSDKPLIRVRNGEEISSVKELNWIAHERILANLGILATNKMIVLTRDNLDKVKITDSIKNVIINRLHSDSAIIPLLTFLKKEEAPFTATDKKLIEWSAEILSSYILKSLNNALIKKISFEDSLTGLANRRSFDDQLEQHVATAQTEQGDCALILLDIDRFKQVNDTFGHTIGDVVLKETAELLQTKINKFSQHNQHLVARYGGEEIAVILPKTDVDKAFDIAEQLRVACEKQVIQSEGKEIQITLSAGVSAYSEYLDEPLKLIEAADIALYQAKSNGRNQVILGTKLGDGSPDTPKRDRDNSTSDIDDLLALAKQKDSGSLTQN